MKTLASFFLRGKPWQIFVLVAGLYAVGMFAIVGPMLPFPTPHGAVTKMAILSGLVAAVSTLGLFVWLWSMGSFFNSIVVTNLKMREGLFHIALVYPPVYIAWFISTFPISGIRIFLVDFLLDLPGMFCVIYLLIFVSKTLVVAETGKPATFSDYAGPFFLLWFFPVGIWIIQPRVNRLYANRRLQGQTLA
jgi:hypothetical protein